MGVWCHGLISHGCYFFFSLFLHSYQNHSYFWKQLFQYFCVVFSIRLGGLLKKMIHKLKNFILLTSCLFSPILSGVFHLWNTFEWAISLVEIYFISPCLLIGISYIRNAQLIIFVLKVYHITIYVHILCSRKVWDTSSKVRLEND